MVERDEIVPRAKLALVDEDLEDLRWYSAFLQQQGYEVCACVSYAEGARCVEAAVYDFIVVSQGGPAFEGRSVLERAMEIDRHTPVLILTRCLDVGCYLEAMQLGALDYLEKPVPAAFLVRFVETHLRPHRAAA